MPDSPKVPINAKIPSDLHDKLLQAVSQKRYKDKTDCITQALEIILNNTHQSPLNNEDVIREKDDEILRITQELRATQEKNDELQRVLRELPNPSEIALMKARDQVIQVLLNEKDATIQILTENLHDLRSEITILGALAYKEQVQKKESNPQVIPRNTASNGLIEKRCKECGNTFFTGNNRKEYCSGKCKTRFGRKMKKES